MSLTFWPLRYYLNGSATINLLKVIELRCSQLVDLFGRQ